MTDIAILCVYIPLALLIALLGIVSLARDREKPLTPYLVFACVSVLGWLLGVICFFLPGDALLAYYAYDSNMVFVSLTALSVFLFVLRFYCVDEINTATVIAVLCVIPCVTLILSITAPYQDYLREDLRILSLAPVHKAQGGRGVWFWVHAGYSYLLVIAALIIAIVQHKQLPAPYRIPSRLLVMSVIATVAGNVVVLMDLVDTPLDFSAIGAVACVILLYTNTRENQGMDELVRARNDVFHTYDKALLVLDESGVIIDLNAKARVWNRRLGVDRDDVNFSEVSDRLEKLTDRSQIDGEEGEGEDYLIKQENHTSINIRMRPLTDLRGKALGTFVICSDVTENRALIDELESGAGIDALTGLPNRRTMDQMTISLDVPESLPLSVIMGDLNYLKKVNDSLGHQQGDVLLRAAADLLTRNCPANSRVGRIGGDEFLILLPGMDRGAALNQVEKLEVAMRNARGFPFTISMALGTETKADPAQSLAHTLQLADQAMYLSKQSSRAPRS